MSKTEPFFAANKQNLKQHQSSVSLYSKEIQDLERTKICYYFVRSNVRLKLVII